MDVFVNNNTVSLDQGSSLVTALEQNGLNSHRGIAVAVNNLVVPKAQWQSHILKESDKITVIKATQGG